MALQDTGGAGGPNIKQVARESPPITPPDCGTYDDDTRFPLTLTTDATTILWLYSGLVEGLGALRIVQKVFAPYPVILRKIGLVRDGFLKLKRLITACHPQSSHSPGGLPPPSGISR